MNRNDASSHFETHDDIEVPEAILNVYPDPESAAAGTFHDINDPEILRLSDDLGRQRAEQVKKEFMFMWKNYEMKAWGQDELQPKSGKGNNNWGHMGVTLVDTLDTLWLMDLKSEFERAKNWVRDSLNFNKVNRQMSFFETNIRMMGGLLSAHDLSGDQMFLDKALDLAGRMLPGFNTGSGIPHAQIKLSDSSVKESWTGANAVLAEFGTLQLEWRYLSEKTNNPMYREKVEKIYDKLGPGRLDGMWPTTANRNTGRPSSSTYTMGALSDSFYEYLLKMWLQGGKKEPKWRKMYDDAMNGMTKHLLGQSGHLHFVGEKTGARFKKKMEHLACFTGGTFSCVVLLFLSCTHSYYTFCTHSYCLILIAFILHTHTHTHTHTLKVCLHWAQKTIPRVQTRNVHNEIFETQSLSRTHAIVCIVICLQDCLPSS